MTSDSEKVPTVLILCGNVSLQSLDDIELGKKFLEGKDEKEDTKETQ